MDAQRHALEREVEVYKSIQLDIQKNLQARKQLLQQSNENGFVLEELQRLDDDAGVFKLIGPALIKQDPVEAKSNVQKRLDYIKGEMERLDGQLRGLEAKADAKQAEILKMQRQSASAASAVGA